VTGMYSNQLNYQTVFILQKNRELFDEQPIFLRRCKYTPFFVTTNVSKINRLKNHTH